jgi:hypothetical protein
MNNDFQTLLEFLDRCGPEVTGKATSAPRTEEAAMLQRFADGVCDERERAEICEMLHMHPAWLRWLADRVKAARNQAQTAPV